MYVVVPLYSGSGVKITRYLNLNIATGDATSFNEPEAAKVLREIYTTSGTRYVFGDTVNINEINVLGTNQIYIYATEGFFLLGYGDSFPFALSESWGGVAEFDTFSLKNIGYNPKLTVTTGGALTIISK